MTKNQESKVKSVWQRIQKFYSTHLIGKLFWTIVLVVLIGWCIYMIPVWQIKESPIPEVTSKAAEQGAEIGKDKGKVTLAQSNGKTLNLYTETMVLEVVDDASGEVFSSAIKDATTGSELALVSVSYLGEDNNLKEWNSFDNCTAFGTYQLYEIENGVQIVLNLNEGESNRFYEYLPKKMSIERYEEVFKAGLEKLATDGTLDEKKAKRYQQTLSLVYKKSIMENCYAVTYTGTPPATAVNQMIELTKLVGYTQEMLLEDAESFDFTVVFSEAPIMNITIEASLQNGELVVSMPAAEMSSENEYYSIQNVKLLPNFGAITAAEYEEGYVFVPDGAGALMAFNSYQANVKNYERPLFDNDYYKDYWYMPEYEEELLMPVFGMLYGPMEQSQKGFLAIVEDGARNGYVHARLASASGDSSKYNKVFTSFDIEQYKKVKINGEYSSDVATYLVSTGMQELACTVRYQFFDKNVTYFDMAKSYQEYLIAQTGMERVYGKGDATLYVEAIGALSIEKRLAGIPYNSVYSMTGYEELQNILQDLQGVNMQVQYDGVFNGGMNNQLNNRAELVSQNGSKKEFAALQNFAKEQEIPLYLNVALSQVGEDGNGYQSSRHAVRNFGNEEAVMYRYAPMLGILSGSLYNVEAGEGFETVAPSWLSDVTDSFLKDSEAYQKLAISDLATMYYADYRFRDFVTGEAGDSILRENLTKLSENKTLTLKNPHMDKIQYGDVAVDVSRKSSDFATFTYTIPFKQLVMNGLIDYTTTDVNLSSRDAQYFVLQAAELGAWPKYTVTAKSVSALKETAYSYLYSVQYELFADNMKEMYVTCDAIRKQIGTDEITGHRTLANQVYETTYANGAKVLVNYNLYEVTLEDGTVLAPQEYQIKEGR